MTIKRHFYRKPNVDQQAWPLDPTFAQVINAESFVYYDTSAKYIKPVDNDAHAQYMVGLAMDQSPITNYGTGFDQGGGSVNPNTDNLGMVSRYGQASVFVTAGESYTAGQALYIGADAQTVTNVAGTYQIGYVSGEQADITTAVAGAKVLVDYRAKYPSLPIN